MQFGQDEKPRVFIGSSGEASEIAVFIQEALEKISEPTVWTQGLFTPGKTIFENLIDMLFDFDFGIFVFSPDDKIISNGTAHSAIRDNVLLELGMFLGKLGADNVFIIKPRNCPIHIPDDLGGVVFLEYETNRKDQNFRAALGPACARIREKISDYFDKTFVDSPPRKTEESMKADIKLIEQAIRILQDTVKRVVDMRTSLGLVYIDIDRFSAINNLYGKENGDRVLETISRLVAKAIPSEFVMRFGADQFLICVKLNNGEDVNKFGQRLMRAISHYQWTRIVMDLFVTVSAGTAQYHGGESISAWIVRAMHGSFIAKKAGGSKVRSGPLSLSKKVKDDPIAYMS